MGPKGLRCLHSNQCRPIGGGHNATQAAPVVIHHLDGVGDRHARDCTIGTGTNSINHRAEDVPISERPRGVMHTDDLRISWNSRQAGTHAGRACCAAGNRAFSGGILGPDDDDHTIARRSRRSNRMVDHAMLAEHLVLLWSSETGSGARCYNDRPDRAATCHSS